MEVPHGAIASGPDRSRRCCWSPRPRRATRTRWSASAAAWRSTSPVDEVSLNTLTVRRSGDRIEFRDPPAYQGLDIGPCEPGEITRATPPDPGLLPGRGRHPRADRARQPRGHRDGHAPACPVEVLGGDGADTLTTGDERRHDRRRPRQRPARRRRRRRRHHRRRGRGRRSTPAPGDDDIRVRDGLADIVRCGDGTDRVDADTFDSLAADCEAAARTATAAAAGRRPRRRPTRRRPTVDAGAVTLQRLGTPRRGQGRRHLERARHARRLGLHRPSAASTCRSATSASRSTVAGGGAELSLKLTKSQLRQARRALKRKRKVTVHLSVVATDAAGNSAQKRAPRIRVRWIRVATPSARERRQDELLGDPAGVARRVGRRDRSVSVVRLLLNSARRVRASEAHERVGRRRGLDLGRRRRPRALGAA